MVVFIFGMSDKDRKKRLFEKSFLLADVNLNIMRAILFLIISNVDDDFKA